MKKKYVSSIGIIGALVVNAFSDNHGDLSKQIEGEWIMYRGDQYDIRKISNGKTETSFYDWKGNFRFKRSSDLKLNNNSTGDSKTIISSGENWHYLAGKNPDDNTWTNLNFEAEEAGWKTGKGGFGYADNDDNTILSDMQNKYTKVYIRKEFVIPEGTELNRLGLLINYDDAFVLYVNGRRLMNSGSLIINEESGEITVNNHEANGAEYFSLREFAGAFKFGKNVIAFEGHNTNLESSDFTLDPQVLLGGSGSFTETNRKVDHTSFRTTNYYKDRTWNGTIDDLIIWNRVLSDDEVTELWNKGDGLKKLSKKASESVIGHWPFNGNFNDVSGNKRNGKGHNSPGFTEGKFGKALKLNGENQYVTLGGDAVDYTPESGSITVSLWFSTNDLDKSWQTLISLGDAGWTDWRIHRNNLSDKIQYNGGGAVVNDTTINDGKLHHVVAITEKGKGVRIYIDNVLSLNNTTNAKRGLVKDSDGWTPAVGANLQQHINLSKSLEGEFIPMQDELRVYSKANFVPNWANQSYSGIYRKTSNPTESLLIASRKGNLEKVKELLDSGLDPDSTSRNSYTALGYASVAGHLDIMKLLISKKADVNKASRFKKVPLNVTAGSNNIEGAKLLIASGAKLNAVNNNGSSIVHEAAFWGQPKMMEFLLKDKGLSANLRANNGGTPLHWAMWQMRRGFTKYNQGYLDCIKLLLKHGANTELRAGNQGTAKEMAKNRGLDEVLALFESK